MRWVAIQIFFTIGHQKLASKVFMFWKWRLIPMKTNFQALIKFKKQIGQEYHQYGSTCICCWKQTNWQKWCTSTCNSMGKLKSFSYPVLIVFFFKFRVYYMCMQIPNFLVSTVFMHEWIRHLWFQQVQRGTVKYP